MVSLNILLSCAALWGRFRGVTIAKECVMLGGFTLTPPGSSAVWLLKASKMSKKPAPPLVTSTGCQRRLQAPPSTTIQRSPMWMRRLDVQLTSDNQSQAACVCFRFCGALIKANHLLRFASYLVSKDLKIRCDLSYLTVAYHGTRDKKERNNSMRLYTVINYCQELQVFLKQSSINVTNSAYLVRVEISRE